MLKFYFVVVICLVTACNRPPSGLEDSINFQWPQQGSLVASDTLWFQLRMEGRGQGLLKLSLVNRNGVSLLPAEVYALNAPAFASGFFVLHGLDYSGEAEMVALWQRDGRQIRKSIGLRLSSSALYEDSFLLLYNFNGGLHITQIPVGGSQYTQYQFYSSAFGKAVWSASAQTLAWVTHDKRRVLGSIYPFSAQSYTLTAGASPFEINLLVSEDEKFWMGEKSGNLRAVNAYNGNTFIQLAGSADTLAYALKSNEQLTAVAFRFGANRHILKIFHKNTGALHSLWPLMGKVIDMRWSSKNELQLALRRFSGVEIFGISLDPPSIRLISTTAILYCDSLFFAAQNQLIEVSGTTLIGRGLKGDGLWQVSFDESPELVALKQQSLWVRNGQELNELSLSGQILRQVNLPLTATGNAHFLTLYAPIKKAKQ